MCKARKRTKYSINSFGFVINLMQLLTLSNLLIKIISIGGGGYLLSSVAKCWTKETAVAIGVYIDENIPDNKYYIYYSHDNNINVQSEHQLFHK